MTTEADLKGIIELDYRPIVCNQCNKILVDTYVRKDDENIIQTIFVYCYQCGKDKGLSR